MREKERVEVKMKLKLPLKLEELSSSLKKRSLVMQFHTKSPPFIGQESQTFGQNPSFGPKLTFPLT